MKKQYELLKRYPGLCIHIKEGDVVEKLESTTMSGYMHKSGAIVCCQFVENFPEFWEEVKEKDYEILSFVNDKGDIKRKQNNGLFYFPWSSSGTSEKWELNKTDKKINSVRRKSDNKIFTVGDTVTGFSNSGTINYFDIDKFDDSKIIVDFGTEPYRQHLANIKMAEQPEYIILKRRLFNKKSKGEGTIITYNEIGDAIHRNDGPLHNTINLKEALKKESGEIYSVKRLSDGEIFTIGDRIQDGQYNINSVLKKFVLEKDGSLGVENKFGAYYALKYIKKITNFFTTHDGYDIFEGEVYYHINTKTVKRITQSVLRRGRNQGHGSSRIYFKKKENAEKWLEDNKLRYSKKDIEEAWNKSKVSETCCDTTYVSNSFWDILDDK